MSPDKLPFFKLFTFILLLSLGLSNNSYSQNSLVINYPLPSMVPRDFFAFSNQALGLSEFAYENSFRDLFVHPGKGPLEFKASAWFSYSRIEEVYNYSLKELVNYNMGNVMFENFEDKDYKNFYPVGIAINLDIINLGLIYCSGNNPNKFQDTFYYSSTFNGFKFADSKGKIDYFKIAIGLNLSKRFNIGMSYSNHNYKRNWKDNKNYDQYLDIFNPSEFTFGASYFIKDNLKIYLSYSGYVLKYNSGSFYEFGSSKRGKEYFSDYKGKVLNLDIKYKLLRDLDLYSRIAFDRRNIETNEIHKGVNEYTRPQNGYATNYRLGIGTNYRFGDVIFISEFNYEPGKENVQFVEGTPGSWDPYITGNELYFKNWNFGFGMEFRVIDELKLQTGVKFYKSKSRLIQEMDWHRNINIDPYKSISNSFMTAGFEFRKYSFVLNYVFNYSTKVKDFYPNLTYLPRSRYTEYNPVNHNFVLRYELK